jgi:hypothetical protein
MIDIVRLKLYQQKTLIQLYRTIHYSESQTYVDLVFDFEVFQ